VSKRGARGRFLDASRIAENESFVAYIDESGDDGFSFLPGCSEWLILSAVVVRKTDDLGMVTLTRAVKSELGKPEGKQLHFRKLKHEERMVFLRHIVAADLKTVSVLFHKPSLNFPETFDEEHRLYFYMVRFLCERISWYCRDNKSESDQGNGEVKLVFENRSTMSYFDMRKYLSKLEQRSGAGFADQQIYWPVIDTRQMETHTAGKRAGLQVADAIAGSFKYATEGLPSGLVEDSYVRMLKPTVYGGNKKQHLGYGLKFFPHHMDLPPNIRSRLNWIRQYYR
jgi:hypothetical protein